MEAVETLSPGAGGVAPSVMDSGRVSAAHAATVEKHRPGNAGSATPKRPVGRPRKEGGPPSGKAPAFAQQGPAESCAPPFAPGVVEKAVRALCATVDRLVQRRTFATAIAVTADQDLAKAFAGDVAMVEEEKQQIATLSETVCLQYAILGQHAPLVFLATSLTAYGTKVYLVLNKLEGLAKFNKLHQEKEKKAKAEEKPNGEPSKPGTD